MIFIKKHLNSAVVFISAVFFSLASQACLNLYHIANADERYLYGLMFKLAGVPTCAKHNADKQPCKALVFSKGALQQGVSDQALKTLSLVSARTIRHCSITERQQLKFTGISAQRIACIDYRDKTNRNALAMLLDTHNNQYKIRALQTVSRRYNDDALARLKLRQEKPWFVCLDKNATAAGSNSVGLHLVDENSAHLSYELANGLKGRCQVEKVKVMDKRNSATNLVFEIVADIRQCQHAEVLLHQLRGQILVQGAKDKVSLYWAKTKLAKKTGCKLDPSFDLNQFFENSKASYYISQQD